MTGINAKPFVFENEFTPSGEYLSGAEAAYRRVEEVEESIASAREEAQAQSMATIEARIAASLEAIVAQLSPVAEVLTPIVEKTREDAIDLSMTAAKVVAGRALDEFGADTATEAIASAANALRRATRVTVFIPPETEQGVALRLENMPHLQGKVTFVADPAARPGDWRLEFEDGAVGFDRDSVIADVEACLEQRKSDPIEDQLDLFSVSAA